MTKEEKECLDYLEQLFVGKSPAIWLRWDKDRGYDLHVGKFHLHRSLAGRFALCPDLTGSTTLWVPGDVNDRLASMWDAHVYGDRKMLTVEERQRREKNKIVGAVLRSVLKDPLVWSCDKYRENEWALRCSPRWSADVILAGCWGGSGYSATLSYCVGNGRQNIDLNVRAAARLYREIYRDDFPPVAEYLRCRWRWGLENMRNAASSMSEGSKADPLLDSEKVKRVLEGGLER